MIPEEFFKETNSKINTSLVTLAPVNMLRYLAEHRVSWCEGTLNNTHASNKIDNKIDACNKIENVAMVSTKYINKEYCLKYILI